MSLLLLSLSAILFTDIPSSSFLSLSSINYVSFPDHLHLPTFITYNAVIRQSQSAHDIGYKWVHCSNSTSVDYYYIVRDAHVFDCHDKSRLLREHSVVTVDKENLQVNLSPPLIADKSIKLYKCDVNSKAVTILQVESNDNDDTEYFNPDAYFQCELSLPISFALSFDIGLLVDWNTAMTSLRSTSDATNNLSMDMWPLVCSSMHSALVSENSNVVTFTTLTANALYDDNTLEYWYNFCGVENLSTVVLLRKQNSNMTKSTESYCTVMDVKWNGVVHRDYYDSILCIEDVLKKLINGGKSLSYVVNAGYALDTLSVFSDQGLNELIAVLKAAESLSSRVGSAPTLQVHSMWRGVMSFLADDSESFSKPANLLGSTSGQHAYSSDVHSVVHALVRATNLLDWEAAYVDLILLSCDMMNVETFIKCNCSKSHWVYSSHRHSFMKDLLKFVVNNDVVCPASTAHEKSSSHFCSNHLPQQQLGTFLEMFATAVAKVPSLSLKAKGLLGVLHRSSIGDVDSNVPRTEPAAVLPSLPYTFHTATIIVFVLKDDVCLAQEVVHSVWRKNCSKCAVVMNIVIFTLDKPFTIRDDACGVKAMVVEDTVEIETSKKHYTSEMQYRQALLCTRKYLQQTKDKSDVIAVLIGKDALLAMIPPGGSGWKTFTFVM